MFLRFVFNSFFILHFLTHAVRQTDLNAFCGPIHIFRLKKVSFYMYVRRSHVTIGRVTTRKNSKRRRRRIEKYSLTFGRISSVVCAPFFFSFSSTYYYYVKFFGRFCFLFDTIMLWNVPIFCSFCYTSLFHSCSFTFLDDTNNNKK